MTEGRETRQPMKNAKTRLAWMLLLSLLLAQVIQLYPPAALPVQAGTELDHPLIALTFDDGPRRSTTADLLDGLAQRGAKATFFLVGEMIPGNEDLILRMEEEGHQIGTHSYDHVYLTGLNAADFSRQVDRTESLLRDILGRDGFLLRPPYGMIDNGVEKRTKSPLILWSIDPEDWNDKNTDRIVSHIVSQAKDGDIILLHDIYPTSVEAALRVVDELHSRGFLFVTVEELAAQRHRELTPGETFRCFYP